MSRRPSSSTAQIVGHAAVIATAIALGIFADLGHKLPGAAGLVPQLGAPWIVVAFLAGRRVDSFPVAMLTGVVVITVGLLSYHFFKLTAYGPNAFGGFRRTWPLWALVALVVGPPSGVAGWLSRSKIATRVGVGWGILAGVSLTEGIAGVVGRRNGLVLGVVEVIAAAMVAFFAWRYASSRAVITSAAVTTLLGLVGVLVVGRLFALGL